MPEKVSTRKGGAQKGAQKYQNRTAFKHNKNSKKTRKIASLPVNGVCIHCKDIIMWRKTYRKYKPLTCPKKCVSCEGKTVTEAYHVICRKCSSEKRACAKCMKNFDDISSNAEDSEKSEIERLEKLEIDLLPLLKERARRSFQRKREKCESTVEVEELILKFQSIASSEDCDFDDDFDDEDDDATSEEDHDNRSSDEESEASGP